MLIKKIDFDNRSIRNEKRMAIHICQKGEKGEEYQTSEIKEAYMKDNQYKGIIFINDEYNAFNYEDKIKDEMAFLCNLIKKMGGDSWAYSSESIDWSVNALKNYYLATCLDYIIVVNDGVKYIFEKTEIGMFERVWKCIGELK